MILDSSAVLAILFDEPEAAEFVEAIPHAEAPRLSAASYVEIAFRLDRKREQPDPELDRFLAAFNITPEPVTAEHARLARVASTGLARGGTQPG